MIRFKYVLFVLLCNLLAFFSVSCSHQGAGLKWSLLPISPDGMPGATVGFTTITDSTKTTQAEVEEADDGKWEKKTIGQHIKDTFWDYNNGWETSKTTLSQAALLYGVFAVGNSADLWRIDEVAFARQDNDENIRAISDALTASANRNKQVVNADVSNSTISFKDVPQDRVISVNLKGNNTDFEFDFQRDTQAENSFIIQSAPPPDADQ
ncbi:MAG: hypothetical protein ACPHF2_02565 [Crocinitomicaceae bacterium]